MKTMIKIKSEYKINYLKLIKIDLFIFSHPNFCMIIYTNSSFHLMGKLQKLLFSNASKSQDLNLAFGPNHFNSTFFFLVWTNFS